MVITYSRVWINRVRLPILLVVSWTGKMNILSPCVPENLVSRDGFSRPVPRQPAHLHTQAESGAYLRDSSRVPRRRPYETAIRHRVSPEFIGSRSCVPMAFTAELYVITIHTYVDPMLLPSGNPFKRHEEVLFLQPMIASKRFDIVFPLAEGCSEGLDAFRFFLKQQSIKFSPYYALNLKIARNTDRAHIFFLPKSPLYL